MEMSFEQAWIENDYNPFIVFDNDGKVLSLNQEAQYLLGEVSTKEIFQITQTYASHTYGFKTTALDLVYGSYKFYAITIGYTDENQIGIKLYKVAAKKFTNIEEYGDSVNIYTLLDLCISAAATRCDSKFAKEFDPTFPELKLKIESFTKLLDKIYQSYKDNATITTRLALTTGEYIRVNDKKYPIFSISFRADERDHSLEKIIEENASKSNCIVRFQNNTTVLNSALVSS